MLRSEDWKKALTEYQRATGEKSIPKFELAILGAAHKKILEKILHFEDVSGPQNVLPPLKKVMDAWQDFRKCKIDYVATLEKMIAEEVKGAKTADEKGKIKTSRYRGLKMLKARLDDYDRHFESLYRAREGQDKREDPVRTRVNSIGNSMQKGISQYFAAEKSIKAEPSLKTWKTWFEDRQACRSLTTALENFNKIEKDIAAASIPAGDVPPEVHKAFPKAKVYIQKLAPYANGNRRTLKEGEDVLKELKIVTALVKECGNAFADFVSPGRVPWPNHYH